MVTGDVPNRKRITLALDAKGLWGPQVDVDLGGEEPMVDQWESGELVPTREQIERLAALTGFLPEFFYGEDPPEIGRVFICGRGAPRKGRKPTREEVRESVVVPRVARQRPVDDDADSFITPRRAREIRLEIESGRAARPRPTPAAVAVEDRPAASPRCPLCGRGPDVTCYMPAGRCRRP